MLTDVLLSNCLRGDLGGKDGYSSGRSLLVWLCSVACWLHIMWSAAKRHPWKSLHIVPCLINHPSISKLINPQSCTGSGALTPRGIVKITSMLFLSLYRLM